MIVDDEHGPVRLSWAQGRGRGVSGRMHGITVRIDAPGPPEEGDEGARRRRDAARGGRQAGASRPADRFRLTACPTAKAADNWTSVLRPERAGRMSRPSGVEWVGPAVSPVAASSLRRRSNCESDLSIERLTGAVTDTTSMRQLDPEHLGDHIDRLFRAAWAMCGSREEAEDLVQETFARVLRKPRLLSAEDDLAYLLRVLRNVHYSACRARTRRPITAPLPEDGHELEDAKATDPQARLESLDVYAEIAALPECLRDAVLAIDLGGMSSREAARV